MNPTQANQQAQSAAESVARRSYGKLVAFLAAGTRDVSAAEDALSEAFAAALERWPKNGTPANPEAWLFTVARRKAIDAYRSQRLETPVSALLSGERSLSQTIADIPAPAVAEIPDHRLALMFVCAHPAIDAAVRAPLILQTILGLDAARIASAFLISPTTMGKRLVRAKEKIRQSGIPFTIPAREELPARLQSVLDAVYAAFTEGWPDPVGTDAPGRDLIAESLFLARLLHQLLPAEPEAAGLLTLILYAESRRNARRNSAGEYTPLAQQSPELWDAQQIAEAEALLQQASVLTRIGRYQLEAALQSAHIHRRLTGSNNWPQVVQLYDALLALTHSPVVAINRAVAIAETESPAAALEVLDRLKDDPRLAQYQPWWAARADLLARTGNHAQARRAYDLAIGLEPDSAVRRFLQHRQSNLPGK